MKFNRKILFILLFILVITTVFIILLQKFWPNQQISLQIKNRYFQSQKLVIKDLQGKTINLSPGISVDSLTPREERIWVTGYVESINQFEEILDEKEINKKINFKIIQLVLNIPNPDTGKETKVYAQTVGINYVITTTDGQLFTPLLAEDISKTISPGQLVRLGIYNQDPKNFKTEWTKSRSWNLAGEMMLGLITSYQGNILILQKSSSSNLFFDGKNNPVVFGDITYNLSAIK